VRAQFRVLTKVSEGLFLGTEFLSRRRAVGELSMSCLGSHGQASDRVLQFTAISHVTRHQPFSRTQINRSRFLVLCQVS
jgi:hypothetical protein